MSENGKVSLYAKLARISGELGAIAKDGKAPDAMGGFAFISHGAVTSHLRAKLAEAQVAILPSLELVRDEAFVMKTSKGERDARRIVVRLEVEFVNGENPEERHRVSWFGEGIDTADKALQKAATSAQKYALMKAFLVSDRDDPDGQETGETTDREPETSIRPSQSGPDADQMAWLEELNSRLGDKRMSPVLLKGKAGRPDGFNKTKTELEDLLRKQGVEPNGKNVRPGGAGDEQGPVAPPAPADSVSPTQETLV